MPRGGKRLGTVKIPMNTGGRVRIGIFIPRDKAGSEIILLQRLFLTRINLETLNLNEDYSSGDPGFDGKGFPKASAFRFLGWISGESYPVKFIPCSVWPALSEEGRKTIVHSDDGLMDLCDSHG